MAPAPTQTPEAKPLADFDSVPIFSTLGDSDLEAPALENESKSVVIQQEPREQKKTQAIQPRIDRAKTTKPVIVSNATTRKQALYDHAKDYSWVKGRLQKVHVPGVEWKIRYTPVDKADQWGGSMVLAPDIRLEGFKDNDAVYIEGEQLESRPSLYVTGPLYRIQKIRLQKTNSQFPTRD